MVKKVLIIATSASTLAGTIPTGSWMEEIAAPYFVFKKAGFDIIIASINGGEIPFDEASLNPPFLTKEAEAFVLDDECMKLVTESKKLADVDLSSFDALFLPGGHGTCVDFVGNPDLKKAVEHLFNTGKIVSAVCHGPVGLVDAVTPSGEPIVKGKKVTGFSDAEEIAVNKEKEVPFLLEAKLKELGGLYEKAPNNWEAHAVRDGNLITGQNPGSSHRVGELVAEALGA